MNNYNNIKMVSEGDTVRYALIKEGKQMLYVFGVNPSTATETDSDPTMTKVIGFVDKNWFDGFAMMNLYPLRSTDPNALPRTINLELHQKNLQKIKEIIGNHKQPTVLLAFGNTINVTPYLKDCLKDIVDLILPLNPRWRQIGKPTKMGNPRHPSRAAYSMGIHDFDVNEYMKKYTNK